MLSKTAVRRLMLDKQGIGPHTGSADKEAVYRTIDRLGCLQIDTINVVERAQYLTLWTRLDQYDKNSLDTLAYQDRRLFEHWAHAASYIPLNDYRYYLQSMQQRREEAEQRFNRRTGKDPELINRVLDRIRDEGPLGSSDFEGPKRKGGWWNWKPAKLALELLLGAGILQVHHRNNFQRYYDLSENVLPQWVNTEPPPDDERVRFFTLRTLGALGAVKPSDIREYYHHWSVKLGRTTKQLETTLEELVSDGSVEKHRIEGERPNYYALASDSADAERLSDDWDLNQVRLLNYFDNLMWNRGRVHTLFGFQPKLEVYLPVDQRVYGYYHLPVLHGDRLVARLEPKLERSESSLKVRGYWLEPGFKPTEEYQDKLEQNLWSLARLTGADTVTWATS
ncbi:MAG: crosslink repair DNA glycosylase YcaQ family protein [Candidatus Bathyarchaeota archaeon]